MIDSPFKRIATVVNAFRQATLEVLEGTTNEKATVEETEASRSDRVSGDVIGIVGFVGALDGMAAICMNQRAARRFASIALEREIPLYDRLVDSFTAELANMVTGRAAMMVEKDGIDFRSSPPSVFSGHNVLLSNHGTLTVILTRFRIGDDHCDLYVGLKR